MALMASRESRFAGSATAMVSVVALARGSTRCFRAVSGGTMSISAGCGWKCSNLIEGMP
jgi:hypothetical protein